MLLNKIILKSIPILILFGFLFSTTRDRPDDFNYNQSTIQAFYFFQVTSIDEIPLDENDWVAAFNGDINISSVAHDYRNVFFNTDRGYGDSGSCNNNVACSVGDDWADESTFSEAITHQQHQLTPKF